MFENIPRTRGIRYRHNRKRYGKRHQKDQRAAEIDERPRARLRLRIENIDAHMTADLQRPGRAEQKQSRLRIEHRFLKGD